MRHFYEPDLSANPDSPFVGGASNKLVRRGYWIDMNDSTLVVVMTQGIGANLTNDEKESTFGRSQAGTLDRSSMHPRNPAT
jgi:hypothetical protein